MTDGPLFPVRNPLEAAQAQKFSQWLDVIVSIEADSRRLAKAHSKPSSRMASDNTATNPVQLEHMVAYCMLVAEDNLRSLRLLVRPDGDQIQLPIVACFPLIRSCLESVSQAVWLMAPDDQRERVLRLLIARRSDYLFDRELVRMLSKPKPDDTHAERAAKAQDVRSQQKADKKRWSYLEGIANRNSIEKREYEVSMPGYRVITYDAGAHSGLTGDVVRGVWHFISGLTHPSVSRGLLATQMEDVSRVRDNVLTGSMTADIGKLNLGLSTAIHIFRHADALRRDSMLRVLPG